MAALDMDALLDKFQGMIKATITENNLAIVAALDKSVDAKIEALRKELKGDIAASLAAAIPRPPAAGPAFGTTHGPSSSSGANGWSTFGPTHPAAARSASSKRTRFDDDPQPAPQPQRSTSAPPPRRDGNNGANLCQVWAVGFPRNLLASTLRQHATEILDSIDISVAEKVTVRAHNLNKCYSFIFPDAASASQFLETAECLLSEWADPKSSTIYTIKFKADRPIETRYVMKVMGSLYGNVKDALVASGNWKPTHRLGTTGPRGTLFLSDGEDVIELYKVRHSNVRGELTCTIEPFLPALQDLGIDSPDAMEFLERAASITLGAR
jgi:hypothetical protein